MSRIAEKLSDGLFTVGSIVAHTILFALWIGTQGFGSDNAGFTIGTALLSLEAIYITLLVGVAVKRSNERERATEDAAFAAKMELLHRHEHTLGVLSQMTARLERTIELIYSGGEHE